MQLNLLPAASVGIVELNSPVTPGTAPGVAVGVAVAVEVGVPDLVERDPVVEDDAPPDSEVLLVEAALVVR